VIEHIRRVIVYVFVLVIIGVALYFFRGFSSGLKSPTVSVSLPQGISGFIKGISSLFSFPKLPSGAISQSASKPPSSYQAPPSATSKTQPQPKPAAPTGAGEVRLSSISPSYGTVNNFQAPSSLTISFSLKPGESLDLTGWEIKSKGDQTYIPQAVNVYLPGGFGSPQDIIVKDNGYLNIYSAQGPAGQNMRLNECIGYLNNTYQTNYLFPNSCPALYQSRADIVNFSSGCQDYITSLGSCAAPDLNNQSIAYDAACKQFLADRANYGGCFSAYRNDPNFLSNQWFIFLGDYHFLNQEHDKVDLYNKSGQLIDERIF